MSVSALTAPSSPYKGLAAFDDTELDALLFFGRQWETEVVAANVLASRLTVFYGPSGVGKSSLLRAGVMRALRSEGGLTPPAAAAYASWAGDPLVGLEEAARAAVGDVLGRAPADAPGTLTDRLAAWSAELGSELCLLLDQLEELFLYHPAAAGAGGFIELLPDLVTRPGLHVNVLLGIRDDALAQLDVFKRRIPGLFANSLRLDHLDRDAARVAILGPLDRYNAMVGAAAAVAIESELVDAVLDEVAAGRIERGGSGRGGLGNGASASGRVETPYLQLVLQRIWEVERDRGSTTLGLSTFQDLGGAQRIVEDHLERALKALTPTQQDAAADVFGHLVTPSGTKIAHGVTDLATYASMGAGELEPVLRSLANERILRPLGENGHAAGDRYEIFHDVLAGAVLSWRTRHESEAALAREREIARRRHRRLLILTAAALLALAAMTALTAYAFSQRSEANEQASRAEDQAEIAATNQDYATLQQAKAEQSEQRALAAKDQARAEAAKASHERARAVLLADVARAAQARADGKAADAKAAEAEANNQADLAESNERLANQQKEAAEQASREATRSANAARRARQRADVQARRARAATKKALAAQRRARARELAQQAFALLTVDPERSLALALDAGKNVRDALVEDSLRQALLASRVRLILPSSARVRSAHFSDDGARVVTASDDGIARIFRVSDDRRRLLHELHHLQSVFSAAFDPTGALVVTAGLGRSVRVWSAETGKLKHELLQRRPTTGASLSGGQEPVVSTASFSSDGRFVLTTSSEGSMQIWRRTGEPVRTFVFDRSSVQRASFSPNGALVAAVVQERDSGRLTARVFDAASGDLLYIPNQRGVVAVAFSPDNTVLATASTDRTTKLWSARSGAFLNELPQPEGRIAAASFSRDGRLIVTASQGGTAAIWEVATGRRVHLLCCPDNFVQSASFSPDGRFVVISSLDRTARVYETSSGRQTMLLAGHENSVLGAEFSQDGRRVVTASEDGTARVWDPGTEDQLGLVGRHAGPVRSVSFSRAGRLLLSAGDDGTARIWRTRGGGRRVLSHGRPITSAVFSPDGSLVATAAPLDRSVRLWSVSSGQELRKLAGGRPERVLFSQSGTLLLTTDVSGPAQIWRVRDGASTALASTQRITAAAFSPDGKRVVGGHADGSVEIWSTATGAALGTLRGHKERVVSVAFTRDGRRIVTASEDATARIWNAATAREEHVLIGHSAPLTDARFDPSGRRVVTAGRDNDARTWSVATGKPIRMLRAHFGAVVAASYSSDGRWIATAGPTTVGLWRPQTGRLLAFLRGPTATVTGASFSPRGHTIAAASVDGSVRVYRCDICGGLRELMALGNLRRNRAHGR